MAIFQYSRLGDLTDRDVSIGMLATERSVIATPGLPLAVTSPNGGETWRNAQEQLITWNAPAFLPGTTYTVRYSLDDGSTWRILARSLTGTSFAWRPPESASSANARIKVEAVGPTGMSVASDVSDGTFTLDPTSLAPVTNLTAIAGWQRITLAWTNPVSASFHHVNIYRTTQPWTLGAKVATIAAPTTTWVDNTATNGSKYYYVVRAATASDEEAMTLVTGGLRGDYYTGADFTTFRGSQVDPLIDFQWGAGGPALAGGAVDNFSIRWSGFVRADQDALWGFDNDYPTRDGLRLTIDGVAVLDSWSASDATIRQYGSMQLQDGWHRVTAEYHDVTGTAQTTLYHSRAGLARRIVPSSELATESQASATPLDPSPPTPSPAGSAQANSPTQITWSLMAVSDAESGLHATPFSYDNASTWVAGSTYARTGLTPNTQYTQTLLARDATDNRTTPNVLTARTLAVAPSVTANQPTGTWLGPTSVTVTFSNLAAFGPGGVEYYRTVWTTNASHTFDDTEPVWNSGNLARAATTSGSYYLHVRSYNGDGVGGSTATYGPYKVDVDGPTANPATVTTTPTLATIPFTVTGASDAGAGLHATPYSFDDGVTWQASNTITDTGLAANTSVSRRVIVRDALGNATTPNTVVAATLPVDPGVTSAPAGGATWLAGGTTVTLTSTVAFGPGTLWGNRWRFTTNASDPVTTGDPAWTSGTVPIPTSTTGTWYARIRSYNVTGNGGNTITLGPFKVDSTAPPAVLPNAPSPTSAAPALGWTAVVDAESGIDSYRIYRSTTSGVLGSQVGSTAGTTWSDAGGLVTDTTYYYTVQAIDTVGNEQAIGNTQIAVIYSMAPPSGTSVVVAGGSGVVATAAVTLALNAANAAEMQVSNAPDLSGASWQPYATSLGWSLAAGADGNRVVYARFRNAGGTVSAIVNDTIDLDTTAPTPAPPTGTGIAGSATSITWATSAASDNIAGLPAQPYSFDDGATWQAGTGLVESALVPNTTYVKHMRARDALGNTTAQGTATATTLAATPAASSMPAADPLPQPRGTSFTFTNDAGWGAGAVEQYRWAWTTSATHTFAGTEAIWNAGTLVRQEFAVGTYYLHLQSFNSEDVAGQTLTLGPYGVAPPQNDTELHLNIASTQTLSCTKTDFSAALLPGDNADATVDCAVTSTLAGWHLDAHVGAAPFFADFVDAAATPAAYAPPATGTAQIAFTMSGAKSHPDFAAGTMWRGFAGLTDIKVATDTGSSAGDTVSMRLRAELGATAGTPAGSRTQTITYTLNPGA
jgi:hypothetical protein